MSLAQRVLMISPLDLERHGRLFGKIFATVMPPVPPKRIFAAAKKNDEVTLLVYDAIGESYWGDGVTAKRIKQALDDAGDVSTIVVRVNSPGGDVFEGSAIYSLLSQHKAKVVVYVDGLAASAAFTVCMAADEIHISESAMMMCHNAWGACMGDANDMRGMAELLEKVSGTMRDIYASHSGKTPDECQALMDAETWMTAQEAVDLGFADDVVKREGDEDEQARALAASFDLSKLAKHPPEALRSQAAPPAADADEAADDTECECPCPECTAGNHDECSNPDCDDPNCEGCPQQSAAAAAAPPEASGSREEVLRWQAEIASL